MDERTYPLNYLLDQIADYVKSENAVASQLEKAEAKIIENLLLKIYNKDPSIAYIKCTVCQNLISKETFKHHYDKCKEKSQKQSSKVQENLEGEKVNNNPKSPYERDLDGNQAGRKSDGSRDYYRHRENGKYGSHPSYDDFDDESLA